MKDAFININQNSDGTGFVKFMAPSGRGSEPIIDENVDVAIGKVVMLLTELAHARGEHLNFTFNRMDLVGTEA